MAPRCPSCKGKMETDPPHYVCTSCGLVINRYQFDKMKREHFAASKRSDDDPEYEQKKKNKDYLDWYLSSNKDKIDED